MDIAPIRTRRDYRNTLKRVEGLMRAKRGTPEGDRLDDFNAVVGKARSLIECDDSAEWPAWEFGW